ncbi:MAG TPA: DUF6252 family protein [Flavobacteriaceae bacterium]|nr:DUF6252 family protein [Flavobacteriaceae bacterium]
MSKNLFFKAIVALIVLIGTSACENEPLEGEFGDGSLPPGATANFQVDIAGETFVADQASAVTNAGVTAVSGATMQGEIVMLTFSGSGTGTFLLTGTGIATYFPAGETNTYSTGFDGMTGEVTVTDYDVANGLISGTFSFTASRYIDPEDETAGMETLEFTNGSFTNVALQSDAQPGDGTPFISFDTGGSSYSFEAYTADSQSRLIRGEEGTGDTYTSISLWMPLDVTEGTHSIVDAPGGDLEAYTANYTSVGEDLNVDATSGTLEITAITAEYIEGTFTFTGTDGTGNEVEITNGEFKAPIP